MKNILRSITLVFILGLGHGYAQTKRNTTIGTIEFEKTINSFAIIKKQINKNKEDYLIPAFEEYQKKANQFIKLKSSFSFENDMSIFTPKENYDVGLSGVFSVPLALQNNIIFIDHSKQKSITEKRVYEQTYLISDTLKHIKWKITDETREIAGYNCRRANALLLDSIYVVAFYADDIPISGGPESFTGLPGMILGLALPHENVSWFATKITEKNEFPIKPPTNGSPILRKDLNLKIKEFSKSWGKHADAILLSFML